jgi:hypothetical protein
VQKKKKKKTQKQKKRYVNVITRADEDGHALKMRQNGRKTMVDALLQTKVGFRIPVVLILANRLLHAKGVA